MTPSTPNHQLPQLTKKQAIEFAEQKAWEPLSLSSRAFFQLSQPFLCMPVDEYRKAVVSTLKRPVYSHELYSNQAGLMEELMGMADAPTMQEIIDLFAEKIKVIQVKI